MDRSVSVCELESLLSSVTEFMEVYLLGTGIFFLFFKILTHKFLHLQLKNQYSVDTVYHVFYSL